MMKYMVNILHIQIVWTYNVSILTKDNVGHSTLADTGLLYIV